MIQLFEVVAVVVRLVNLLAVQELHNQNLKYQH